MNSDTRYQLAVTQQKISDSLGRIEKLFEPHCKLTFIMRNPKSEDGHMILTRDDLDEVIKVLQLEIARGNK